jgi:oxygen-independent coproporphyrinogen-3 oxidase
MVEAIILELQQRAGFFEKETIHSIYFGGGTPSLLSPSELAAIMEALHRHYTLSTAAEVTLEANPDDIQTSLLSDWQQLGIGRLSLGIQSFQEQNLRQMNRAHSALEAVKALQWIRDAGFQNISLDLIYGLPWSDAELWAKDIATALRFKPEHLSAYALTIEPKTAFGYWVKKGKMNAPNDDQAALHYEMLLEKLDKAGYEAYEVSNFCLPGFESKHNSSYWLGKKYLGIGPSAHSFDGKQRRWNLANNTKYMRGVRQGEPYYEQELLTPANRYNEYLLTALRTKWGLSYERLRGQFGLDANWEGWSAFQYYIGQGLAEATAEGCRLTAKGRLLADEITAKLFAE